jgi:hypothetical protein
MGISQALRKRCPDPSMSRDKMKHESTYKLAAGFSAVQIDSYEITSF